MKQIFIILFYTTLFINFTGFCQSKPYQFQYKTEIPIVSYSLICGGISIYEYSQLSALTQTEISNLSSDDINSFDRIATNKYSSKTANICKYITLGNAFISIASVGATSFINSENIPDFLIDAGTLAGLYFETFAVTYSTNQLLKLSTKRIRPFVYNQEASLSDKLTKDALTSFFSWQTTFTAANTFFAASVIYNYYPKTWLSYTSFGIAAIIPAVVGTMRIEAGKHFPSDVITGYIWGTLCGTLIPYMHTRTNEKTSCIISPNNISITMRL